MIIVNFRYKDVEKVTSYHQRINPKTKIYINKKHNIEKLRLIYFGNILITNDITKFMIINRNVIYSIHDLECVYGTYIVT